MKEKIYINPFGHKDFKDVPETVSRRVVDFENNPTSEYEIGQAFAHVNASNVSWIKKDYGMVILCDIKSDKVREFESRIGNIHGVIF